MVVYERELTVAVETARIASRAVMALYETAAVHTKPDGSYVTEADYASDRIIREQLGYHFPADAILTEEGVDSSQRFIADRCWIVDPIDGTASFVEQTGDFDIYIALVVDHRPVVAVSLQPATGLLLTASAGSGARIESADGTRSRLRFRRPAERIRLGTRGWLGAPDNLPWLTSVAAAIGPDASVTDSTVGLGARSFLQPAAKVDAIVGCTVTGTPIDAWEWDIAAVDLIVREAGGGSTDLTGNPLRFNQPHPRMTELLLSTDLNSHVRILRAMEQAPRIV